MGVARVCLNMVCEVSKGEGVLVGISMDVVVGEVKRD